MGWTVETVLFPVPQGRVLSVLIFPSIFLGIWEISFVGSASSLFLQILRLKNAICLACDFGFPQVSFFLSFFFVDFGLFSDTMSLLASGIKFFDLGHTKC